MKSVKPILSSIPWGKHNGQEVRLFKLENVNGSYVEISNYGATIVSIVVPDKDGQLANVVLGFPSIEGYIHDSCYIGSTIGRFANRIGGAKFTLDGIEYHLEKNDNENTNHGGYNGFNSRVFNFLTDEETLILSLHSKDTEGGYPGNLDFKVSFRWDADNQLLITYSAISDKKTVVNFTNHSYFNLSAINEKIFRHQLTIRSDQVLEVSPDYIPTGKFLCAEDKLFIQNTICENMKVREGRWQGLNTFYLLNKREAELQPAAILFEERSGRKLEVFTSYSGIMLYTGDHLSSSYINPEGRFYQPFDGLCLECQHPPDAPNHENFASTTINPGEAYQEYIQYKFSVSV